MPAAKIFLTSADISAVMGISIRQAQYTLNMFDQRGQTVRNGRKKMVDLRIPLIIAPKPSTSSPLTKISRKSAIQAHCLHAK